MIQEELINIFKHIVKKCDMFINNNNYKADNYTQDIVEDIAELCNHIIDGDYGKLVELKDVDLEKEIDNWICDNAITHEDCSVTDVISTAKHFFELGSTVQKEKQDIETITVIIKYLINNYEKGNIIDARNISNS